MFPKRLQLLAVDRMVEQGEGTVMLQRLTQVMTLFGKHTEVVMGRRVKTVGLDRPLIIVLCFSHRAFLQGKVAKIIQGKRGSGTHPDGILPEAGRRGPDLTLLPGQPEQEKQNENSPPLAPF